MGIRLRSKTGCATCRRRRKKCDERQPICSACARLKLRCWYGQETAAHVTSTHNNAVTLLGHCGPVATIPRLCKDPPLWRFQSIFEQTTVQRAPSSVLAFYGPLCCKEVQDLRLIWQMMHHDDLLYHATIACFSVVFGRTPQYGQLCRSSYCAALQQARERLTSRILYRNDLIVLQTTVFFLGLMDSVGPEQSPDLLLHWRGLAQLLAYSFQNHMVDWYPLQKNVFILVLESAVYHLSCQMLFTKDASSIWKLWRKTRIHEMLEETNPQGLQRIANSPIMGGGGDYVVYNLVVQLTYLSRSPSLESSSDQIFDDIESSLLYLYLSLKSRVEQHGTPTYPALNVYVMFLGALSILLAALREPSHAQNQIIDEKASEVLEEFCKISSADMNHAPTSWPVQILACAIRHESDFVRFKKELVVFKARLNPGHTRRLEAILEQVARIRLASNKSVRSRQYPASIPPALALLRKPDGILS